MQPLYTARNNYMLSYMEEFKFIIIFYDTYICYISIVYMTRLRSKPKININIFKMKRVRWHVDDKHNITWHVYRTFCHELNHFLNEDVFGPLSIFARRHRQSRLDNKLLLCFTFNCMFSWMFDTLFIKFHIWY